MKDSLGLDANNYLVLTAELLIVLIVILAIGIMIYVAKIYKEERYVNLVEALLDAHDSNLSTSPV